MVPLSSDAGAKMPAIDNETKCLIRIAAAIAGCDERTTRSVMEAAVGVARPDAVEEVILQSYLFAGFPRTLNAARAWRVASGTNAPASDDSADLSSSDDWVERGEETCRTVYGESYDLLRRNIRSLHPALDSWMITDGYGKVLSRPQLDLKTRELCIVAACAASGQQRQLHSHLHGALNSGASVDEVLSVMDSLADLLSERDLIQYRSLLAHVASKRHPPLADEGANVR